MKIKGFLVVFLGFLILSCSRNPVTGKRDFMLMTEGQEISLGKESDPSIVASFGLYNDPTIQKFINEKGNEMAKISHRPHLNYEFKVLDSPVVNAFAVPGGYVYFTRGILAHFNNEAEFSGVLGHEIGHITARHSAKQYSKQMISQVLFVGGLIVSEKFRQFAGAAQQGMGLLFLKFGRDHESESDKLGVEYSSEVGYDAHEMAHFFNTLSRLQSDSGSSIPDFLSTHPNPVDRNRKVGEMATATQKQFPNKSYKVNRDKYLNMIDGLIYGEDPKQGYVENNVFYHPELKFQFPVPTQWQLANSPSQVQIAPKDGKAAVVMMLSQEKTPRAAGQKFITDNKLVLIEQNSVNVNGLPAYVTMADYNPTQQGETPLRILSYFIQYNNLVYQFNCMAAKTDFNSYYREMQSVPKNFAKLTDQSKINKKPERIKIVTANKNATISQLLKDNGMSTAQQKTLLVLNGMNTNDQVKKGTLFKILERK